MSNFGKAIKKPIPIDWFLYTGDAKELESWVNSFGQKVVDHLVVNPTSGTIIVNTMEGHSYEVPVGYYILRGIKGEYYPCEGQIFKDSYTIMDL